MSSLLPLATPARTRTDAPAAAPERRATDAPHTAFADSLSAARDATRGGSTASGRPQARDDTQRDERNDGPAKTVRSPAQLQALMLSGAMKFASTRASDATEQPSTDAVQLTLPVFSLPAQPSTASGAPGMRIPMAPPMSLPHVLVPPDMSADPAVMTEPDATAAPGILLTPQSAPATPGPAVPQSAPATPDLMLTPQSAPALPGLAMPWSAPDAPDVAMPVDGDVQSLPAVPVRSPADRVTNPDEDAATPATQRSLDDLATPAAATLAAMQLVAQLPMPLPAMTVIDDADTQPTMDDASGKQRGSGSFDAANGDSAEPTLVEDHFDAPAAQLDAVIPSTMTASGPSAKSASGAANVSPATATSAARSTARTARIDVSSMQSDVERLAPEFRDRLERVMDRMRSEFGHTVTVLETVRSQARQEALYAQGRTTPGAIVTWTKNSRHSQGMAADLMVDGQWQNPMGYAHLAEIAKQEGLRTLGARDPGHVELPSDSSVSGETLGNLLNDLQGEPGDTSRQLRADVRSAGQQDSAQATMARVADVAQVARVASVAEVAKVASVSRPGARAEPSGPTNEAISPLAVSGAMPSSTSDTAGRVSVATAAAPVNMSDRISHLLDLQATQAAKPLSSVLLRMENANGVDDQIRIDTRGTSVDARLGLGNAQQAAALTDRLGELRDALERRGLTADGVRVQATSNTRATDSVQFSRTTAPTIELAAMRAAADSQAQGNTRDQSARDQQQREAFAREQDRHTPRPSSDDARHRSRREQPEDRR